MYVVHLAEPDGPSQADLTETGALPLPLTYFDAVTCYCTNIKF